MKWKSALKATLVVGAILAWVIGGFWLMAIHEYGYAVAVLFGPLAVGVFTVLWMFAYEEFMMADKRK